MSEHSLLERILANTEKIMSQGTSAAQALADLQAAEAANASQITTLQTAVTNGIAQLTALIQQLQAGGGVAPSDIEAVVTKMTADAGNLTSVNSQIVAAEQQNLPAKS